MLFSRVKGGHQRGHELVFVVGLKLVSYGVKKARANPKASRLFEFLNALDWVGGFEFSRLPSSKLQFSRKKGGEDEVEIFCPCAW